MRYASLKIGDSFLRRGDAEKLECFASLHLLLRCVSQNLPFSQKTLSYSPESVFFDSLISFLFQNESSLSIDWLPMSHDVIESSRRPPKLKTVHVVDVGQETTAIVIELLFDLLNMKLRSTYELRVSVTLLNTA